MKRDLWTTVSAKFLEALELPREERQAFVAGLRRDSGEVAAEVESLLASHDEAPDFLEQPMPERLVTDALVRGSVEELAPGATIDGFEIVRPLGRGAFATVYLARELALGRLIALKVSLIRGHEGRTMASLEHEHVVRVFSERLDVERDVRLICMQYVAGASLRRVLEEMRQAGRGPGDPPLTGMDFMAAVDRLCTESPVYDPTLARSRHRFEQRTYAEAVAWLGARLAAALGHAHQVGVLHLDVKPDNILVSQYAWPYLADFNVSLAQAADEAIPGVASAEMLGGTFPYMAPEHRRAYKAGTEEAFRIITPAADLYALGVVLHEVLAEAKAATPEAQDLRRILAPCLAERPEDRYPTAAALGTRLDGFLTLMGLRRALPPAGFIARISLANLILGLFLFITGPQSIGSLVNIAYNASRIVAELNEAQRAVFQVMLWVLNPIFYGVGVGILFQRIRPIHRVMQREFGRKVKSSGSAAPLDDQTRQALRQRALRLPTDVAFVVTSAWGIGCLAFPLGIHFLGGPLHGMEFLHFGVSFFLSWIVALTYSMLYSQYLVVRVIYPRLLLGDVDLRATARKELRGVSSRLQLYQALAGLIPSLAATLLLGSERIVVGSDQFDAYRWLLVGLIASGAVGFLVALRTANVLGRTIYALTDGTESRGSGTGT